MQTRSDAALQFCKYWFINVWSLISVTLFPISVSIKNFFMHLNSAVFMFFICENRKLAFFICVKHFLFQHNFVLHKNPKWTAMQHSQIINGAKHSLSSNVFSPLFTQSWKLLPGYYLFLLSIHSYKISSSFISVDILARPRRYWVSVLKWVGWLRWSFVAEYRKFPKCSDTQKICCYYPKSWTRWLFLRVMHPKDAEGIANSVDPDQTAPLGAVWSGSALFAQACPSENLGK